MIQLPFALARGIGLDTHEMGLQGIRAVNMPRRSGGSKSARCKGKKGV